MIRDIIQKYHGTMQRSILMTKMPSTNYADWRKLAQELKEHPHGQYGLQGGSHICGVTHDRKKPDQRAGPVWEQRHASYRAREPPVAPRI